MLRTAGDRVFQLQSRGAAAPRVLSLLVHALWKRASTSSTVLYGTMRDPNSSEPATDHPPSNSDDWI